MKQAIMTPELMARLEARGFKRLPPDHPIYSEGPSITFSSRTPKPSDQKAIVSLPIDSPTSSV